MNKKSFDKRKKIERGVAWGFFAVLSVIFLSVLISQGKNYFSRYLYELDGPFTWDTTIYYAVGKGMSHGLLPYWDLFETKPPMIFFLSELSYLLTGDFYLCNILSFLLLVFTALSPALYIIVRFCLKREKSPLLWCFFLLAALSAGMLFGGYDQLRSGEVQVELFGATFIVLYFLCILSYKSENRRCYSPVLFLSAVPLMIGVMFKEPFLLIALAGSLLICKSGKDFLYKLVFPCLYGGIMGVLLMAVTGVLGPYLTIYLPHMLSAHIGIYGSPFERMWQFEKILDDLKHYSSLLKITVLFCLGAVAVATLYPKGKRHPLLSVLFGSIKIFGGLLLVSFSVGLGGQYYNHHFIFALPYYILLFILSLEGIYRMCCLAGNRQKPRVVSSAAFAIQETNASHVGERNQKNIARGLGLAGLCCLILFSASGIFLLPEFVPNVKLFDLNDQMKENAAYLDDILDELGEDTYQYFGFNGPVLYAYTRHDPLGPAFFQDPANFTDSDNFFSVSLKKQLDEANVCVVSYIRCGVLDEYVNEYLSENFVVIKEKSEDFPYRLLVRAAKQE